VGGLGLASLGPVWCDDGVGAVGFLVDGVAAFVYQVVAAVA